MLTSRMFCLLPLALFLNILLCKAEEWKSGQVAEPGEIKYTVYLMKYHLLEGCTGAIISELLVISAASCFVAGDKKMSSGLIKVIAGTNDIWNTQDPRRVEVEVEEIYIPPDYHLNTEYADIAVISLKQNLNLGNNLQKLILPDDRNLANLNARLVGFAYNQTTNDTVEVCDRRETVTVNRLRYSDMTIMSNEECTKKLDSHIEDSHICASINRSIGKQQGACAGSFGSPLVYDSNILVGVYVLGSNGCDFKRDPGLYTRVASFKEFILSVERNTTRDFMNKLKMN